MLFKIIIKYLIKKFSDKIATFSLIFIKIFSKIKNYNAFILTNISNLSYYL